MRKRSPRWLIVGPIVSNLRAPSNAPAAYADLLRRFGPGTFNAFVRLRPKDILTYGQRLSVEDDRVLCRHAIFAESDNGDASSWDVRAGRQSALFRFAPRSFRPRQVARAADDLLARLGELARAGAPLRPFFVPARSRHRRPRTAHRPAERRLVVLVFDASRGTRKAEVHRVFAPLLGNEERPRATRRAPGPS